jgi:hypothetical protein
MRLKDHHLHRLVRDVQEKKKLGRLLSIVRRTPQPPQIKMMFFATTLGQNAYVVLTLMVRYYTTKIT